MSEIMEFNINYYVDVKLNQSGLDELIRQHEELQKIAPSVGDFRTPKIDENGYSRFQLHSLMLQLGHMCRLGFEPPFDTIIKIDTNQR